LRMKGDEARRTQAGPLPSSPHLLATPPHSGRPSAHVAQSPLSQSASLNSTLSQNSSHGLNIQAGSASPSSPSLQHNLSFGSLPSLHSPNRLHQLSDEYSDEDTEDARSSDDDDGLREDSYADIREQMYQDKLASLRLQLQRLQDGNLPEYQKKMKKLDLNFKEAARFREVAREYEMEQIEKEYVMEKKTAVKEFEERKIELRQNLISELEEKKKVLENERQSLDLTSTASSIRLMTSLYDPMDPMQKPQTRTLRKRTAETRNAAPNAKRVKNGQPAINLALDDDDIDSDLKTLQATPQPSGGGDTNDDTSITAPSLNAMRIENGKLFYDKKWFRQGQPVYLEGKDGSRDAGVIVSINQDQIWIRKIEDRIKIKVHLTQLAKQKFILRRRTP